MLRFYSAQSLRPMACSIGLVLGSFVLAAVPLRHVLARRGVRLRPAGVVAGAGVFGLVSGIASATGVILISVLLGAWLVERHGARLHVLAIEALIVVGGITMLWRALKTP